MTLENDERVKQKLVYSFLLIFLKLKETRVRDTERGRESWEGSGKGEGREGKEVRKKKD